jgi:beta-galactosidase/beta-glucuronidase
VPIFLQGGNWIATDQFMRYSDDQQRYSDEVNLHRDMNMNLIRVVR